MMECIIAVLAWLIFAGWVTYTFAQMASYGKEKEGDDE